jgi:hypothetical protein
MTETDGINPNITFLAVIESFAPGVPIAPHEGQAQLTQLPHFSDGFLISCGLAGAFSDYFGSIA